MRRQRLLIPTGLRRSRVAPRSRCTSRDRSQPRPTSHILAPGRTLHYPGVLSKGRGEGEGEGRWPAGTADLPRTRKARCTKNVWHLRRNVPLPPVSAWGGCQRACDVREHAVRLCRHVPLPPVGARGPCQGRCSSHCECGMRMCVCIYMLYVHTWIRGACIRAYVGVRHTHDDRLSLRRKSRNNDDQRQTGSTRRRGLAPRR